MTLAELTVLVSADDEPAKKSRDEFYEELAAWRGLTPKQKLQQAAGW